MDDEVGRRLAANESLFRQVNESINRGRWPGDESTIGFRCECAEVGCNSLVTLTPVEYEDIAGLVEKLRSMPDKTVLVVAHSDTLPGIIEKLGAGKVDPIKEDEFDRLFVFHHTGPTSGAVVTLRYCDCS